MLSPSWDSAGARTGWRIRLVYSPAVLSALARADVGLDLPYRYRYARGLHEFAVVDQAGEDYREWLSDWAAILAEISQRQAAGAEKRFNRRATFGGDPTN